MYFEMQTIVSAISTQSRYIRFSDTDGQCGDNSSLVDQCVRMYNYYHEYFPVSANLECVYVFD